MCTHCVKDPYRCTCDIVQMNVVVAMWWGLSAFVPKKSDCDDNAKLVVRSARSGPLEGNMEESGVLMLL